MNVVITPQAVSALAKSSKSTVCIEEQKVGVEVISCKYDADFGVQIVRELVGGEPYDGSYSVIPSNEVQTLPTSGKLLARNVVVGAIPSNYGLISWNGSYLTVS